VKPNLPFENPVFESACKEIEELGFRISGLPLPDSTLYAVVGARFNPRWWLIPLTNRRVTNSALALFQPVITSARLLKGAAAIAISMRLAGLWARNRVYISGESCLSDIFRDKGLCYAFFTGTDSPHRKVAVQIMDEKGFIKGFAKVSCKDAIKPLLKHEAKTLSHIHSLNLQTALIPNVLFCGSIAGAEVLVIDTRKTSKTKTAIELSKAHIEFLAELAEKTTSSRSQGTENVVKALYKMCEAVADRLPNEWQRRLRNAIGIIEGHEKDLGSGSLSHGDFTPWNTFFVDGRLYVFDWEYTSEGSPPGSDLIHFILSLPATKRMSAHDVAAEINKVLLNTGIAANSNMASLFFLCYLCVHSLRYSCRQTAVDSSPTTWDGEPEARVLIDLLLGSASRVVGDLGLHQLSSVEGDIQGCSN